MTAVGSDMPAPASGAPKGGWTSSIDDVREGRWVSPKTGRTAPASATEVIVLAESLDGQEAELVQRVAPSASLAVVADVDTYDALGRRVIAALRTAGRDPREVILDRKPHADMGTAGALAERLDGVEHVVAVGSGTVNDLSKYVTAQDGRTCSVFGTAASMDGYTSSTASMAMPSGLKISLPAHAPKGVFLDLGVLAAAPPRMAAAGFGDCLCSSVARIDWWMSHRLFESFYIDEPYLIAEANDAEMNARAAAIGRGELDAVGYLARALTLSGLAVGFTGVSNHGSMGEHQISHYIDCFAGKRHPGTLHGQQVGVASLTMARLQQAMLVKNDPPTLRPTVIDEADMARRMGSEIAAQCRAEYVKKALTEAGAEALNARLEAIWPELRQECLAFAEPVETMRERLRAAGGPTNARELGLDADFYREAVRHAHEMRNRFSFADLACESGELDGFSDAEAR